MINKKEKTMEVSQLSSIKKDFFFDMEDQKSSENIKGGSKLANCLFSTDSLSGY